MKRLLLLLPLFLLVACTPEVDNVDAPDIILNGTSIIKVEIGDSYTDQGAYVDSEDTYELTAEGIVDTSTVGQYQITYSYDFEGTTISAQRTVVVEDNFPIAFYLIGSDVITIEKGDNYRDPGVFISDVTIPVTVDDDGVDISQVGTYTVTFTITVDGLTRVLTRTIEVIPNSTITLELSGDNPLTLQVGDTWVDPGYVISNPAVTVQVDDSSLDTSVVGTYSVYYRYYQDSMLKVVTRTVIVE